MHVSAISPVRSMPYLPGLNLTLPSQYKSWRLTGLYVFCAVLFTAGFIVRVMGAFDYKHLIKFIVSTCLIYAAPYFSPPHTPSEHPTNPPPQPAPSSN